jgi:hypothetical protein
MAATPPVCGFHNVDLLRFKRWPAVLLLSILLHFVAIRWAGIPISPPSLRNLNIMHATLQVPAAPQSTSVFRKDSAASARVITPVPSSAGATALANVTSRPSRPLSGQSTDAMHALPVPLAANHPASVAPQRDPLQYRVQLPPPVQLRYEVKALKKGLPLQGQAIVKWEQNGAQYRIEGMTTLVDGSTRSFQSEGNIDQSGIAPVLYSEKSNRKSATNTHFQHARKLISFSSSTITYPLQGGEQDRASIVWQLAGIGRATPEVFVSGVDLDMFVAGVRDGESWHVRVIGEEQIDLPAGKTGAWHLIRIPHAGTYEQQLDIWLSPGQAWYPVKLRYTQRTGDNLDMSLSEVSPVSAH